MSKSPVPVRLRLIALPVEHGGWGLLGGPLILGLMLAPTAAGVFLAVSALGMFLLRHPLRLMVSDLQRGKSYPRTRWALLFASAYAALSLAGLLFASAYAQSAFWQPLIVFAVLGLIQIFYDLSGRSRSLIPEASGALALSLFACAIGLAGGRQPTVAWIASCALGLHAFAAIIYVAARLKLERGTTFNRWAVWSVHLLALSVCVAASIVLDLSWWLPITYAVLAGRSIWGLSPYRMKARPAFVGVQEVGYSLLVVFTAFLSLNPFHP